MMKYGNPPYLECSSRGDRRFSAFNARLEWNGTVRSIEEIYQAAKVLPDGRTNLSWREAKGQHPINSAEVRALYRLLWRTYIQQNPHLHAALISATGLSDQFAKEGSVNQAEELWLIRQELLNESV